MTNQPESQAHRPSSHARAAASGCARAGSERVDDNWRPASYLSPRGKERRCTGMTHDTTKTQSKNSTIPEFKSREEEAVFWDTHSFADYWDEAKPVQVQFAKNLSEGITIRL